MKILLLLTTLYFNTMAQNQAPNDNYYINHQYEDENATLTADDIKKLKVKLQNEHDIFEGKSIDSNLSDIDLSAEAADREIKGLQEYSED